ncbi:MAG: class E sortase [Sporichthyaceae bacterium]|nr:class E sortase [Sporichthyaceae bacterium]
MTVRKLLRGLGWSFIGLGCFVLYFLVYQLVGTDIQTNRAQADLRQQLAREWSGQRAASGKPTRTTPVAAKLGEPIALLQIPKIKLMDVVIVQGTNRQQLAKGPGHVPSTSMPGQPGTFGVSGHRTTHSHPFFSLDELTKGDTIRVLTQESIYAYTVTGSRIVLPTQTEVLDDVRGPDGKLKQQIVLTTCHPRYSAARRLVVFGDLADVQPNTGKVAA